MAEHARDEEMRFHGVHPDQQEDQPSEGAVVKMPGGREGIKRQ